MCFLIMRATAVLELMQTASRKYSDVLRLQARSRVRSDDKREEEPRVCVSTLGDAFSVFRVFYTHHLNWTNLIPVWCSCVDHDWGAVDLFAPRKVRSGKMKASGKLPAPARGCVLSEAFCAHSKRRKPHKMLARSSRT